jgi:hypothetical protein
VNKSNRGGPGRGQGRRPLPPGQKRVKCSPTLAPGIEQLARAIADKRGYNVWGMAIDDAIKDLAKKMKVKI